MLLHAFWNDTTYHHRTPLFSVHTTCFPFYSDLFLVSSNLSICQSDIFSSFSSLRLKLAFTTLVDRRSLLTCFPLLVCLRCLINAQLAISHSHLLLSAYLVISVASPCSSKMRNRYDTHLILSAIPQDDFATTVSIVSLQCPYKNLETEVACTENGLISYLTRMYVRIVRKSTLGRSPTLLSAAMASRITRKQIKTGLLIH